MRLLVVLTSVTVFLTAVGCGLVATVTPGPGSVSTPEPTVAATALPTATATVQETINEPTSEATEALTATPGSDSISTLEPTPTAIDTPPPTEIVQEPITECNAGTLEAPPEAYADFVDLLTKLWLLDAELCSAIVKQPWILGQSGADGGGAALKDKLILLESLYNLASTDLELADLVVSVPWFADELTYWKRRVVLELSNLAAKNADLARIIAGFPLVY